MLLFMSHATDYVFLGCEFFVKLFGASEAERALILDTFFFRKTKNGRSMYADTAVEQVMRLLHTFTGKGCTLVPMLDLLLLSQHRIYTNDALSIPSNTPEAGHNAWTGGTGIGLL